MNFIFDACRKVALLSLLSAGFAAALPGSLAAAAAPAAADQSTSQTQPSVLPLWPAGAPGALGEAPADRPEITVHLAPADQATGAAVVICPGGGYNTLMMTYEGHDIAKWLNDQGIAGIVLKYRVRPYHHPAALQDGRRAMRLVRSHAAEWKLDADRIGIGGFSAGGHVAAMVGTRFDAGDPKAADPIDRLSCRPDFMILIYPVITADGPEAYKGLVPTLLGANASQAAIDDISPEKHVTADTPPAFLAHAKTDQLVPVANSQMFAAALQAKKVPVEYFELPTGEHGLGAGKGPDWTAWQEKCAAWLKDRGFTAKKK
jgi:acetyl esterase/lipase